MREAREGHDGVHDGGCGDGDLAVPDCLTRLSSGRGSAN